MPKEEASEFSKNELPMIDPMDDQARENQLIKRKIGTPERPIVKLDKPKMKERVLISENSD